MMKHQDGGRRGIVYHWQGFKGDIPTQTFPTLVDKEVVKANVGRSHYLFLTRDKQVFACGSNKSGQLGIGTEDDSATKDAVLVEVLSDKSVVDVVCGFDHSAAVCENGDVYCWGESSSGECGTGKSNTITSPQKVEFPAASDQQGDAVEADNQSGVRICQVACGRNHTLAVSTDGQIWAWGSGIALGVRDITFAKRPILVERLVGRRVLAVCCGENHSIALVKRSLSSVDQADAVKDSKLKTKQAVDNDDDIATCAACKQELFSFSEMDSDTCVISGDHLCLIESEISPTATRLSHSCSRKRLNSAPSENEKSEHKVETKLSEQKSLSQDPSEETSKDVNRLSEETTVQKTSSTAPSVGEETQGDEASSVENSAESSTLDQVVSVNPETLKIEKTVEEEIVQETAGEKNPDLSVEVENVADPPSIDGKESCADENSPIWKMRPDFVAEQKTSDSSPPAVARSVSEGSANTEAGPSTSPGRDSSKVVRSRSALLNDAEARKYLAKQLEEEPEKSSSKNTKDSRHSEADSPSMFQSLFSSTVASGMQQMFSSTSKAVDNIRSYVTGMSTDMDVDKAINEDLSRNPHEDSSRYSSSNSVAESSFSNNSEGGSNAMNKSVASLNLSPEASRRSSSSSERRDSPDQSGSPRHSQEFLIHQLETRTGNSSQATLETEVWTWGKNNKGQLGQEDMGDRDQPCCIKMMSNRSIVKVVAGGFHSLALTASSQVYSWGANSSGQLGHEEDGPSPTKLKSLSAHPVWDIAAGQSHSLFLVDSAGFTPDVCYCGKQPREGVYAPVVKTTKPVVLNFLKKAQTGWVRRVITKGDNCLCIVDKDNEGGKATQFEYASTERTFNMLLLKIATQLTRPLHKSPFYSTVESHPYRVTLLKMLESFIALARKIGRNSVDMTRIIREGDSIMAAGIIEQCEEFVTEFQKYSCAFSDFLAVGGFEYVAKLGSQFFDNSVGVFQELLDFVSKNNHAQNFCQVMRLPFDRIKEYSRLTNKMTLNFADDSTEDKHLRKCCLLWEKLRASITAEYNTAESTRAFWDTLSTRLAESQRVPRRRLIKTSKTCPLTLYSAGRFSAHLFVLFDDTFVHIQGSSFQSFPLTLVWVETPPETEQLRNVIVVTTPEESLTLCAPGPEIKAEWIMALNQAINKALANQKHGRKTSGSDRLTPPLVRHATFTFTKLSLKDAVYKGFWFKGIMNGQGELTWTETKKYVGKFKLGLQHGHGTMTNNGEIYEGNWKDGKMHGLGRIKYSTGDCYEGYMRDGVRSGHGVFRQGRHTASTASVYIGEWLNDKRHGYGVMDDVLKGEKYMGVWSEDARHGAGIVVTLDGMYFEGNFFQDKMVGFGVMLTDDNSCYEGEFSGITQLSGKGVLTMPNGDRLAGMFSGSWNEGLKVNATFLKNPQPLPSERRSYSHDLGIKSSKYGQLCVLASEKWEHIFSHFRSLLGYNGFGKPDTNKAWEVVAVMVSSGRRALKEGDKQQKSRYRINSLEELEKIPPHSRGKLSTEHYTQIQDYLIKAFESPFHPLGKLIESLVDVFRAAYVGVGAHPRLLHHAVDEIRSFVKRIYGIIRILFPDLPRYGGPSQIFSEAEAGIPLSTEAAKEMLETTPEQTDETGEVITPAGLLHPVLLPKVYPPLFDLYALFNDKEDEKYWERVQRLNRQGDMALMAYLGIDQKFWLIDEKMFGEKRKSLSTLKDECYAVAVDNLQRLSTAFSPAEKLAVIEQTFFEISKAVQTTSTEDNVWCMDDLFPIFQFVVVRSKIRHLGAEIHMIEDLMEPHLEYGEFGLMFTTLKACYFQIQTEKLPMH